MRILLILGAVISLMPAISGGSLMLRIAGDFLSHPELRLMGGWGNVLAILSFFACIGYGFARGLFRSRIAVRL